MGRLSEMLGSLPPPAYETVANHGLGGGSGDLSNLNLPGGLDASIWLLILQKSIDPKRLTKEQQSQGWSDLHKNVRFCSKDLYLLCMHLLRSKYVERYISRVRAPFSTDPYPAGQSIPTSLEPPIARNRLATTSTTTTTTSSSSAIPSYNRRSGGGAGRETRILDLFVAAQIRSDIESFESTLLQSSLDDDEEGENDLFAYHQPKCRIEDLVIQIGRKQGLIRPDPSQIAIEKQRIALDSKGQSNKPIHNYSLGTLNSRGQRWIEAEDLAIELRSKSAILRLRSDQSASRALRTVFEVNRLRDEVLEVTADRILNRLAASQ